jgi:hypothetical protein
MPKLTAINSAIGSGLSYLATQQEADGGFLSFSSPSVIPFKPVTTYKTTFTSSLILDCLANLDSLEAYTIKNRLAKFLVDQRSPDWTFNYWAKSAPQRRTKPYPDDLDDTFCALSALFRCNPEIISEAVLAKVVKQLLATEVAVGGPYRTWLVPSTSKSIWLDVDLAVNSNIAYFLSLVSNPLPSLDRLMEKAILSEALVSPYYPSRQPIIYYLSRAYKGVHKAKLTNMAKHLLQVKVVTALNRSLCLSSLIRLDETRQLDTIADKLLNQQQDDGSWSAAAFCIDPSQDKKPYYNGAASLTTAFAIEALQLYASRSLARARKETNRTAKTAKKEHDNKFRSNVLAMAKVQCRSLSKDFRLSTLGALSSIADGANGLEITALPYYFNQSLAKPLSINKHSFFTTLGLANLYGWLAYTIYDDFLDGESQPNLLPVANVTMRGSVRCFAEALPRDPSFQKLVEQTFNTIDTANAWELANCHFACDSNQIILNKPLPDYGDLSKLAERSLGHSLTPLGILIAQGFDLNSQACRQLKKALSHYLIARQLNDDIHDWQADINNGRVTYVVRAILEDIGVKPGSHNLNNLLPTMRQQFWHTTLKQICHEMQRQTFLSHEALSRSSVLRSDNVVTSLLSSIENSIQTTLSAQTGASSFLKSYRQQASKL